MIMSNYVDLHIHSTFSDGTLTPTEIVQQASRHGLRAIALADHDNIDGIPEATHAAQKIGLEVLTGVELSVVWQSYQDIHLLGYDFDPDNPGLNQALVEFRNFRVKRNRLILEKINQKLIGQGRSPLAKEHVESSAGGTIGRPHIGQALVAAGYAKDLERAFDEYLVPCNVPKRYFPIDEAISLVHAAGGCAVLAHPPFIKASDSVLEELLSAFIGFGLDGLEVYNTGTDNQGIDQYITIARQMDLVVTGGSDFHQPVDGGVKIGVGRGNLKIPYQCVEEIRSSALRYKTPSRK
jgi:predicted metal-dependent phosphoesterase TrpH